jgi:hypothetical protein
MVAEGSRGDFDIAMDTLSRGERKIRDTMQRIAEVLEMHDKDSQAEAC